MKKKDTDNLPEVKSENRMGRRDFFKAGTVGAAGTALGFAAILSKRNELAAKVVKNKSIKLHEDFPVKISDDLKRFRQKNTVFSRGMWDNAIKGDLGKLIAFETHDKNGWSPLDRAISLAGWSMEDQFAFLSKLGNPMTPAYAWEGRVREDKYKFKSAADATKKVKKAARFLGADLVGISKYNPLWGYDPLYVLTKNKEVPAKFPFQPKSVIVMAIEMDYRTIATSPSYISDSTVGLCYSRMAELANSVTTFLRELGYKSFGSGNDIAMSIPYAIEAGLGELGRNGLLVTYEYGPRVRLCKVFTELELIPDKPISFGVQEFCKMCGLCAEACPSKAIPFDRDPTWKGKTISNNNGAYKWYIDPEKCMKMWGENDCACINCVASCPYNKPDMWHHRLITGITKLPGNPLHYSMVKMDRAFGFGNTYDQKAIDRWWDED